MRFIAGFLLLPLLTILALAGPMTGGQAVVGQAVASADHHVAVRSKAPTMMGRMVQIYVRERARPAVLAHGAGNKIVLFIHGAGTPAEVAFDVPYKDYSWMAYLARAGYDVFSVDMEGYGRSARPPLMDDPCNLAPAQQSQFIPSKISVRCQPSYSGYATTIESDWNDIGAAVRYIEKLRHVEKVNLIGWSMGGPRAGGWAALHPNAVAKLVLLAPAYSRAAKAEAPASRQGAAFNTQSRAEFDANWARQTGCPDQVEQTAADSVWHEMLASDPVGAGWGPGVRRAPRTAVWGWTSARVKAETIPTLMVSGQYDRQVDPKRVRELYADLGAKNKVFVDLACSSHNAMWEKNHLKLFAASLEWLQNGTVNGQSHGMLKLGY
jgi:pimeloyl-ACP methyl ester carboxylesterase